LLISIQAKNFPVVFCQELFQPRVKSIKFASKGLFGKAKIILATCKLMVSIFNLLNFVSMVTKKSSLKPKWKVMQSFYFENALLKVFHEILKHFD
jgi:hypothetical protein